MHRRDSNPQSQQASGHWDSEIISFNEVTEDDIGMTNRRDKTATEFVGKTWRMVWVEAETDCSIYVLIISGRRMKFEKRRLFRDKKKRRAMFVTLRRVRVTIIVEESNQYHIL